MAQRAALRFCAPIRASIYLPSHEGEILASLAGVGENSKYRNPFSSGPKSCNQSRLEASGVFIRPCEPPALSCFHFLTPLNVGSSHVHAFYGHYTYPPQKEKSTLISPETRRIIITNWPDSVTATALRPPEWGTPLPSSHSMLFLLDCSIL